MKEVNNVTVIEQLQEKVKISLEAHESQTKQLIQIQNSIKQLGNEEKKIIQNINVLFGSYTSFQEALKILQEEV